MTQAPQINLARRIIQKYTLSPPVDIFAICQLHANLEVIPIPFDIDGICLDLKVPGRRPRIILNDSQPPTRKRFTLAHELGHVLIPWHFGTIVDDIEVGEGSGDTVYWELEREANQFAAELLMPSKWISEIIEDNENPCEIIEEIRIKAEVSIDAALIRLVRMLIPGYVYAILNEDGVVISSGQSTGTLTSRLERGSFVDLKGIFPTSNTRWSMPLRGGVCAWWHFSRETALPEVDETLEWRNVLDEILDDLELDEDSKFKIKQTVNGIVAFANSAVSNDFRLKKLPKTPEAIYAASIQRFDSRRRYDPIIEELVDHRLFSRFLALRAKNLAAGPRKK